MPLFDTYNRLPTVNTPRIFEVGNNLLINSQVFDGATLSRKSSKLIEIQHNRDALSGICGFNVINTVTKLFFSGDLSDNNSISKTWLQDSVNPNIYYVLTNTGVAGAFIYTIDMSTYKIVGSAGANATAGGTILGQDANYVYALATFTNYYTYLIKYTKANFNVTFTLYGTVGAYIKKGKVLYADQVNGNFWIYETLNATIRSITKLSYVQGWTAPDSYPLAATTTSTVYAGVFPTMPDANRQFWVMSPQPSSANLGIYYNQADVNWGTLTQSNVSVTINWNGFTATDVQQNGYSTANTWATAYACFLVGTNKMLVVRSQDSGTIVNTTPQYNRWWIFDISGLTTATLLNTNTFNGNPNYCTKLQKAPDGRFYMFNQGVGLQFFTYNDAGNTLVESTLIPMSNNPTSFTFDSYGRLWYQLGDYSMYFMDNTTAYDVTMTLDTDTQQYTGANLTNNLNISTWDYAGNRVATNINLYISGNGQFTANSGKTIQITTSASGDTVVPITIIGTGQINFSAKPV